MEHICSAEGRRVVTLSNSNLERVEVWASGRVGAEAERYSVIVWKRPSVADEWTLEHRIAVAHADAAFAVGTAFGASAIRLQAHAEQLRELTHGVFRAA